MIPATSEKDNSKFEIIQKWYVTDEGSQPRLTPELIEYRDLLNEVDDLLREHKVHDVVMNILLKKKGIGKQKARKLITEAGKLFGAISTIDKQYNLELSLQSLWELHQMAMDEGKISEVRQIHREIRETTKVLDDTKQALADLPPPVILYTFDPSLLGMKVPSDEELKEKLERLQKLKRAEYFAHHNDDITDVEEAE